MPILCTPLEYFSKDKDADVTKIVTLYLLSENGTPLTLGSGRYAKVILASTSDPPGSHSLCAVKLLVKDESTAFNRTSRERFYQEVVRTRNCLELGTPNDNPFIPYMGFGSIGSPQLPPKSSTVSQLFLVKDDELRNDVVSRISVNTFTEQGKSNGEVIRKALPNLLADVLGEFMVLELAYGTLDDLITLPSDLSKNSAVSMTIELSPDSRAANEEALASLRRALPLDFRAQLSNLKGRRGFDVLDLFTRHESLGSSLRTAILLKIFRGCVEPLSKVHGADCAHRDLKPGNFLIKSLPYVSGFYVSDLGFVASKEDIVRGQFTMVSNSKDPGVLTPGTKGFRAIEQSVSGDEVSLQLAHEPKSEDSQILYICPRAGTAPENGDVLESNHVKFDSGQRDKENNPVLAQATRIFEVQVAPDNYGYYVRPQYRAIDLEDSAYYSGVLLKDVGFHSDIFSLGCLAFYLFSNGRGAEQALGALLSPAFLELLGIDKSTSCLAIALDVCAEDNDAAMAQLEDYFQDAGFKKKARSGEYEKRFPGIGNVVQRRLSLRRKLGLSSVHGDYVRKLVSTDTPTPQPIPLLLLWIVFSCCLRDRPDSICIRETRIRQSAFAFRESENVMIDELMKRLDVIVGFKDFRLGDAAVRILNTAGANDDPLRFFSALRQFLDQLTVVKVPQATLGKPYSHALGKAGAGNGTVWKLAGGQNLPAGLRLSEDGLLSGTAHSDDAIGDFEFSVIAKANNKTRIESFQLAIRPDAPR